jgi:hypothetical protein
MTAIKDFNPAQLSDTIKDGMIPTNFTDNLAASTKFGKTADVSPIEIPQMQATPSAAPSDLMGVLDSFSNNISNIGLDARYQNQDWYKNNINNN